MMWSISGVVHMAAGATVFGVWLAAAHRRDGSVRRAAPPGRAEVIADTAPLE
jgi:hypothetical protein